MVMPTSDPPIRVFVSGEYWRVDYGSYMGRLPRDPRRGRRDGDRCGGPRTPQAGDRGTGHEYRCDMSAEAASIRRLAAASGREKGT